MTQAHSAATGPGASAGQDASQKLEKTFLARRPGLGTAWIADLKAMSTAEKLFMRTFQGAINRTQARLYLIDSDHAGSAEAERFWIEEYERRGWIEVGGTLDYPGVLAKFGSEVAGFVAASEAQPWTIHAATVVATLRNGVVAPDAVAGQLRGAGWRQLDDMRGRWSDAGSAYQATVEAHGAQLAYPGLAILRHTQKLWDFVVQQEIMPVYTRPKHDTWADVAAIMDAYPGGQALYGYVSDDGIEEGIAVERASASGKYLVPTDGVSNLSFHVAVQPESRAVPVVRESDAAPAPCSASQVNVVIAISDGDNLGVPILQYPQSTFWNTEARGSLPLGWSMGVSLSVLAPGIWEFYRSTAGPNDEIVSLMGIAYVHASALPDPEAYYRDTFSVMGAAGIHTLWSLDSSLAITDDPLWQVLEGAPGREALHGVVVGYGPGGDKAFRRDTGTPVMITQNGYSEDAARIRRRIEALMARDPGERAPVNFLMATNWNTSARDLYQELRPLVDRGVRFLTPSQALACMPAVKGLARSVIDADASPGTCLPTGPLERLGSPVLSVPTLAEVGKPIPIPVSVAVEATKAIRPGGIITYLATLRIDADRLARDFLKERVLPLLESHDLSQEFARHAWVKLVASDIRVALPLPKATRRAEIASTASSGAPASAVLDDDSLLITLDTFTSDSRTGSPLVDVSVSFTATHDAGDESTKLTLAAESVRFGFVLTLGFGDEAGPFAGGVSGTMAGRGAADLAKTIVER